MSLPALKQNDLEPWYGYTYLDLRKRLGGSGKPLSQATVYRLLKRLEIEPYKIGRIRYISREDYFRAIKAYAAELAARNQALPTPMDGFLRGIEETARSIKINKEALASLR